MRSEQTSQRWFSELLAPHRPPCVSIYQPVHRAGPPAAEDPVRFRNAVEKMQQQLRTRYDTPIVKGMVEKVQSVAADSAFWRGDRDAIALFASPDLLQLINLQQQVDELVVVADMFHVKPLIRIMQEADRYQLLCIEAKRASMYEGNRHRLWPIEMRNVPRTPEEVAGMRLSSTVTSVTDITEAPRQMNEGNGSPAELAPLDAFLRAVDKGVWENHSRPTRLPLILVAAEKMHPVFRQISRNPCLVKEGIKLDPHHLPEPRLREEAWRVMEPIYAASLQRLQDEFRSTRAHNRASDQLLQVAEAVAAGRVGTLLVEANRQIPGRLLRDTGFVLPTKTPDAHADDLLDVLAEMVLTMDGQVLVMPPQEMPTDTGIAAIYRY